MCATRTTGPNAGRRFLPATHEAAACCAPLPQFVCWSLLPPPLCTATHKHTRWLARPGLCWRWRWWALRWSKVGSLGRRRCPPPAAACGLALPGMACPVMACQLRPPETHRVASCVLVCRSSTDRPMGPGEWPRASRSGAVRAAAAAKTPPCLSPHPPRHPRRRVRFSEHAVPAPGPEQRRHRQVHLVRQAEACRSARCSALLPPSGGLPCCACTLRRTSSPADPQACTACGACPLAPAPPPTPRLPLPPPATPPPPSARWWPPRTVRSCSGAASACLQSSAGSSGIRRRQRRRHWVGGLPAALPGRLCLAHLPSRRLACLLRRALAGGEWTFTCNSGTTGDVSNGGGSCS